MTTQDIIVYGICLGATLATFVIFLYVAFVFGLLLYQYLFEKEETPKVDVEIETMESSIEPLPMGERPP